MQRKIIIDTSVYIDIFNHNLHTEIINPFQNTTYLAYPVLHELWTGLKSEAEIRALIQWRERFVQLKRFVIPTVHTLTMIGKACLQLKTSGNLDPVYPKHYNDVSIAAIANQIGAIVLTKNLKDFKIIRKTIDFEYDGVS
jgi:predicted nucleic acid-binding protein